MTQTYREGWYTALDGLRLYFRDYGDPLSSRAPLLCLTGLTRNSKDYEPFARRLAAKRRVICPDYRGRGRSAYDPNWHNYRPEIYVGDVVALLAALGIGKVVAVGTSLGGIVSMGLAMFRPTALAGVVLNDVGPVISRDGLARIAGYVGQPVVIASLAEGAARLKAQFGTAYPDLDDAGWRRMADQIFREETAGRLVLDYDLSLGKAIAEAAAAPPADLWPLFRGLRNIPTLGIWGVLSDVLSKETFERMKSEHPAMVAAEVKSRGHVPLLEEDELVPTLDGFLDGIA